MNVGKYFQDKINNNNYSLELQNAIKEACCFCIEAIDNDDQDATNPLMLLGKIQSGKTRAFTGLMALAFDNQFDMAIILTKNSSALVKQTYKRMRYEFKKEISDNEVEVYDIMKVLDQGLTDYELDKKIVLVAKKQHKNLDRISKFITDYTLDSRKNCLIIDDEADTTGIGFYKIKDTEDEFDLRKVASKVNDLRGTLNGCVFVQVTATPYALYLQPDFDSSIIKPIKPVKTVLIPSGEGYVGGDYYFFESQREGHPARLIFQPVSESENELVSNQKRKNKKSKINDRRTFKIEDILHEDNRLIAFKRGLMNFVIGGCVLRLINNNTHYSYVIHTATQKTSHISLENVTREFFSQIKDRINSRSIIIDNMIIDAYVDIKQSYSEYGFNMPSSEDVKKSFYNAIIKDYISVTVVNSDKDIDTILDEDSGELRLRSPFSVFVGGQVLDRGVTIPRMIGFYYGRNPITMQQDTVMQHSRMFGYRSKDLLSVTRFYTTKHIFENMTKITEIDKSLREDIENNTFTHGIYFIRKHIESRANEAGQRVKNEIVPCSPAKIALSSIVLIKSHSRILPIGFNTIPRTYANKTSRTIDKLLHKLVGEKQSDTNEISPDGLNEIIENVFSIIEADEDTSRFITKDHFMSTIQYLSKDTGRVFLYIRKGGQLAKYKNNGVSYQDAPDTGYELNKLRKIAVDKPVLMLIHQDGTADGWSGGAFWWPVLIVQKNAPTTVFALNESFGKLV